MIKIKHDLKKEYSITCEEAIMNLKSIFSINWNMFFDWIKKCISNIGWHYPGFTEKYLGIQENKWGDRRTIENEFTIMTEARKEYKFIKNHNHKKNHKWCMRHDKVYREAFLEWIKEGIRK